MKRLIFKIVFIVIILVILNFTTSCVKQQNERKSVDFYNCSEKDLPDGLRDIIENKKSKSFEITYSNDSYLYIAVGYGEMSMDNLRVVVKDVYETSEVVCIETTLLTEDYIKEEGTNAKTVSALCPSFFPAVVVRLKHTDKPVVFKVSYNR